MAHHSQLFEHFYHLSESKQLTYIRFIRDRRITAIKEAEKLWLLKGTGKKRNTN